MPKEFCTLQWSSLGHVSCSTWKKKGCFTQIRILWKCYGQDITPLGGALHKLNFVKVRRRRHNISRSALIRGSLRWFTYELTLNCVLHSVVCIWFYITCAWKTCSMTRIIWNGFNAMNMQFGSLFTWPKMKISTHGMAWTTLIATTRYTIQLCILNTFTFGIILTSVPLRMK